MSGKKYTLTETEILEKWANEYPSVQVWLSKINGTRANRALRLYYFCEWSKKTPEQLLKLKQKPENLEVERLLDLFICSSKMPESTIWNSVNAVKSFFRCNYRQLQRESGKIEYVPKKEQRRQDKDKRREIYQACFNQRDRALVMVAFTSAIALETLANLKWSHFEEDWEKQEIPHISIPSELIKGHGKGRFKGVRQETFVTPEAKKELVKYREYMTREKGVNWTRDLNVFLCVEENNKPLTYSGLARTLLNISQHANIPFSAHDGRRIVETALENVSVPRNWIQKIKGRKVRGEDAPYSKPAIEQLRQKYKEALPELEFLHAESAELRRVKAEYEIVKANGQNKAQEIKSMESRLIVQEDKIGALSDRLEETTRLMQLLLQSGKKEMVKKRALEVLRGKE
jgi:hypothetical protein